MQCRGCREAWLSFRVAVCLDPWEAPVPPTWRLPGGTSATPEKGNKPCSVHGAGEELSIEELVRKTGSEARDNSPPIPQVESSRPLPGSRGLLTSPTSGCFKQQQYSCFYEAPAGEGLASHWGFTHILGYGIPRLSVQRS